MTTAIERSAQRPDVIGETARASIEGRGCAILGCEDINVTRCNLCPAHYCREHLSSHFHTVETVRGVAI